MKNLSLLLGVSIILISCGSSHKATLERLENTNYQMSYDAMRRGTVVSIDKDGNIAKILSEVQPDAAIAKTTDITSKLAGSLANQGDVSVEQMTKITETLSKLGERTSQVNMLRDALYRIEEHCVNFPTQCTSDKYWSSFNQIITAITTMQTERTKTAEKEVEKADIELRKMQNFRNLTPEEKGQYYKNN